MEAMASLPGLLLFCDYLENRLHTSSLTLLRRMVTDFYAGNEHTLLDFMRLGASVVSVMPMERTNPRHRKEAVQLLTKQKRNNVHNQQKMPTQMDFNRQNQTQMDTSGSQQSEACVFRFLSARVATKNILWLRDMFHEFCKGEDVVLREFVLRGNEPICVIPVDIQALCLAPLPPPPLRGMETGNFTTTSSQVALSPMLSPQRKRRWEGEREQQGTSGEMDTTGNTPDSHRRKQSRRTLVAARNETEVSDTLESAPESLASPAADEVRQSIVTAMERIEEKEPWKCVFKLETLAMPFSRVRHPELADALQAFWQAHARAVWERKFWSPLSRPCARELHNERRFRQSKAQTFFEKSVLIPVYKELGASFFVDMDRRATLYSGWFYLDQAVDLFMLAQRYGLSACLQYMESEVCKRFPVVPGVSRKFFSRVNGKSQSMWSSSAPLRPALNKILAAKAKMDDNNPS